MFRNIFGITLVILIVLGVIYILRLETSTPSINQKQSPTPTFSIPEDKTPIAPPNAPWLKAENWIKPEDNPILSPTEEWEGKDVLEPTVLFEDGIFKMWYTGGLPAALGYATSEDGIHWIKHESNPIYGLGFGDEKEAVRQNNVIKYKDTYYLFYVSDSKNMYLATSIDGITFKKHPEAVLKHDLNSWDANMANSYQWVDDDGKWYMIYESQYNDSLSLWHMGLAYADSPFKWYKYSHNPLLSIQKGEGMFGGPWVEKIDDTYYLFHHAAVVKDNLPTDIYLHYSKDLQNWYSHSSEPLVKRTQPEWELDQVADPSLVEANGRTYMFYDGNDNTVETGYRAWIGYVYYEGLISETK